MKGKIFVLFIMVGIPAIAWAFLAWATMITLGILHSACSIIPPLSFLESFVAVLMLFCITIFAISAATEDTRPARRHGGR